MAGQMGWFLRILLRIHARLEPRLNRFLDGLSVARVVLLVFSFFILLGSLGIYISEKGSVAYIDALYLAASAVCVTGLTPIPLSELNHITHWILLICIQLGGLGIISFTVLIGILIIRGESRNTKFNLVVRDAIDATEEKEITQKYKSKEVRRILFSVVNISLTLELMGAIVFYNTFPETPEPYSRWFYCLFTSVSAFNNAGFSISNDLSFIAEFPTSIYSVSLLVVLGGIGFPVIIYIEKVILQTLKELFYHLESRLETYFYYKIINDPNRDDFPPFYESFIRLSHYLDDKIEKYNSHLHGESNRIQYKILFYGTLLLLSLGTGFVLWVEDSNPHTLYGLNWDIKLANAFFISACSRTAGFTILDFSGIHDATVVIITILMFIGGGPQGTAGGVKITTVAILSAYLRNVISPSRPVQIFGETISKNSIAISIRVYFLATTMLAMLFILLATLNQNQTSLHVIFFEMVSAFSTVGYSLGLTPYLGDIEKVIYATIMLIGRIGVFTVLIALTGHSGVPRMGEDDGVKIQVG